MCKSTVDTSTLNCQCDEGKPPVDSLVKPVLRPETMMMNIFEREGWYESRVTELEAECDRRKDYLIHLLQKQAIVIGLNAQDKEWLRSFGITVAESV